jgi:hypothetical protein
MNRLRQEPEVTLTTQRDPEVKSGTIIAVAWTDSARLLTNGRWYTLDYLRVLSAKRLLADYALVNPHARFTLWESGIADASFTAANAGQRFRPDTSPSPHWYTVEMLGDLILADVRSDPAARTRTIYEFLAGFAGLTGTAKRKAVTDAAGLTGKTLADLVHKDGLDEYALTGLLTAMCREARVIKPTAFGPLGEDHVRETLARDDDVIEQTFRYRKINGTTGAVPFLLEVAFGRYDADDDASDDNEGPPRLRCICALNRTPILRPFILDHLAAIRAETSDAIVLFAHLIMPRARFLDAGKVVLDLGPVIERAIGDALAVVCKQWVREKRRRDRGRGPMRRAPQGHMSIKDAAYQVMAEAYAEASDDGRLPTNVRQIMYAARPRILELTGVAAIEDRYFTQKLVPGFLREHPEETASWDVIYDARGRFTEPHTGAVVDLGTLPVRDYMDGWRKKDTGAPLTLAYRQQTHGPRDRYGAVLYIEKEGFAQLFAAEKLAERFDLAIMSNKGYSVTAGRDLIVGFARKHPDILIFAAHDCDVHGFGIAWTLGHDTERYQFACEPNIIDIGLRLEDVREMGLGSEPVTHTTDPLIKLIERGASLEEIAFLRGEQNANGQFVGQRVELNGMSSAQLIAWLEQKFAAHGVRKIIPNPETLAATWRWMQRNRAAEKAMRAVAAAFDLDAVAVPDDIMAQVCARIAADPTLTWDGALAQYVRESGDKETRDAS